ncbi:hypothetical protein HK098_000442 [Nowakowskiella sp. JEL0407]|nr:hypothetical protein HK098_000442 [Nowakowskiella sp. JEL0407]
MDQKPKIDSLRTNINIPFRDVLFDIYKPIAHGGSATIHKGVWAGIDVAVKVFRSVKTNADQQKEILDEVKLLSNLRHEHIIVLYGVSLDTDTPLMVLEYADGGSLYSYMQDHPESIGSPDVVCHLLHQISLGMMYLHSQDPPILHGDLKAANCLLRSVSYGILSATVKISDFGLSKIQEDSLSSKTSGNISGTLCWLAPERLNSAKLSKMVDVYAFSMTTYEILTVGKLPFELNGYRDFNIVGALYRKERPARPIPRNPPVYSEEQWKLMEKCWNEVPSERPTFAQIIAEIKAMRRALGTVKEIELEYHSESSNGTFAVGVSDKSNVDSTRNTFGALRVPEQTYQTSTISSSNLESNIATFHSNRSLLQDSALVPASLRPQLMPVSRSDIPPNLGYLEPASANNVISSKKELPAIYPDATPPPNPPFMVTFSNSSESSVWKKRRFIMVIGFLAILVVVGITMGVVFSTKTSQSTSSESSSPSPSSSFSPFVKSSSKPSPTLPVGSISKKFTGHMDWILSVAAVTDSSPPRLFTASADKTVREWNYDTGVTVRIFSGHTDRVQAMAILPGNPPRIFTGSRDATIIEWNSETGQIAKIYTGHKDYVFALAVNPDPPRLYSGSWDDTIREWDLTTGLTIRNYTGHTGDVFAVSVIPGKQPILLSGSSDKTVLQWDTSTGAVVRNYTGNTLTIRALSWSLNGTNGSFRLFSGCDDGVIREWDPSTGKIVRVLNGHTSSIYSTAILSQPGSPPRLFSASLDTTIREWDVNTGLPVRMYNGHAGAVESITLIPNYLISGGEDNQTIQWVI